MSLQQQDASAPRPMPAVCCVRIRVWWLCGSLAVVLSCQPGRNIHPDCGTAASFRLTTNRVDSSPFEAKFSQAMDFLGKWKEQNPMFCYHGRKEGIGITSGFFVCAPTVAEPIIDAGQAGLAYLRCRVGIPDEWKRLVRLWCHVNEHRARQRIMRFRGMTFYVTPDGDNGDQPLRFPVGQLGTNDNRTYPNSQAEKSSECVTVEVVIPDEALKSHEEEAGPSPARATRTVR